MILIVSIGIGTVSHFLTRADEQMHQHLLTNCIIGEIIYNMSTVIRVERIILIHTSIHSFVNFLIHSCVSNNNLLILYRVPHSCIKLSINEHSLQAGHYVYQLFLST